jgi:hypothetical protein
VANEISKLELDDGIMVLPLPEGTTREIAEELSKRIKLVRENGMHAPFVHGITEQDGHLALMMDRPLGPSYTQWMSQSPYHWNKMISLLAHEAHEVHMHKLPELPSIKDLMWERIKMDSSLPDLTRRQVLGALKKMSDMDHVLNWNFIPTLVIVTMDEPMALRWDQVCRGPYLADVARSIVLLRMANTDVFAENYGYEYLKICGRTPEELDVWIGIVAADKLVDGVPEERDRLRSLVQRSLSSMS